MHPDILTLRVCQSWVRGMGGQELVERGDSESVVLVRVESGVLVGAEVFDEGDEGGFKVGFGDGVGEVDGCAVVEEEFEVACEVDFEFVVEIGELVVSRLSLEEIFGCSLRCEVVQIN